MTELEELKNNYALLANTVDVSNTSILEIADKYLNETDSFQKDKYAAVLMVYCWPALEKLYYKQNVKILSLVDCYDIFLDSFFYVMDKCVWKDENHSLYNDEDAILKAMYVLVESRRKNYFVSQNRQKRVANQYPVSLNTLSEEFQDGFFSPIMEKYNFNRGWEKEYVQLLWKDKLYITALIFDVLVNLDVFDEQERVNVKKIKKYIKNLSEMYYNGFIERYDLEDNGIIYDKYIKNVDDGRIYDYIYNAFSTFKRSVDFNTITVNNAD